MTMKRRAMFSAPLVAAGAVAAVVSGSRKAVAKTTEISPWKLEIVVDGCFKDILNQMTVCGQSNSIGFRDSKPLRITEMEYSEQRNNYYTIEKIVIKRQQLREFANELQNVEPLHNYKLIFEDTIS